MWRRIPVRRKPPKSKACTAIICPKSLFLVGDAIDDPVGNNPSSALRGKQRHDGIPISRESTLIRRNPSIRPANRQSSPNRGEQ